MDQNHHFWICLISALTLNFERLFRGCLFLMKDYLWLKFQQTQTLFEGGRAQKFPKSSHFMDAASPWKHLKLFNLTTTNATLMNLAAMMYLHKVFNLAKDCGVTHRAWKKVNQKPLKMSHKIVFWLIFRFF